MKFRSSFVTNSSSSSFIIAIRNDCGKDDIVGYLKESVLTDFMNDGIEMVYDDDYNIDVSNNSTLANAIAEELLSSSTQMEIGDWKFYLENGSNEGDDLLGCFLYFSLNSLDEEKLKIISGGY